MPLSIPGSANTEHESRVPPDVLLGLVSYRLPTPPSRLQGHALSAHSEVSRPSWPKPDPVAHFTLTRKGWHKSRLVGGIVTP